MRHRHHAIVEFGAEEQRRPSRRGVLDVEQHEAEIARTTEAEIGGAGVGFRDGKRPVRRQELEGGGKLARAEAGLVKALAASGAAVEDVEVLALAVVVAGPRRSFEMGGDDIFDVNEHGGRPLLPVLVDQKLQVFEAARFIAVLILPLGALWPTSLRRIDWKRIGLRTRISSITQRMAGFQWMASRMPRAADGVMTS